LRQILLFSELWGPGYPAGRASSSLNSSALWAI
jgi:hypothetical protein